MGPIPLKEFKVMIREAGCEVREKNPPHYYEIVDGEGKVLSTFAATHGKNSKRDEIKACYVRNFKNALKAKKRQGV